MDIIIDREILESIRHNFSNLSDRSMLMMYKTNDGKIIATCSVLEEEDFFPNALIKSAAAMEETMLRLDE